MIKIYWETQLVLYYLLSWSVYYNAQLVGRLGSDGVWDGDYGWGVRYAALLAHAEGVLYGTELGSVTLKRVV